MDAALFPRRLFIAGATIAWVTALIACQAIAGIADLTIGECKGGACLQDADTGVQASSPSSEAGPLVDGGGAPCPGHPLPPALRIGEPGNTFCIDSTEVSVGKYKQFLAANVDPATQEPECLWNQSFTPAFPAEAGAPADDLPVNYVNRCDAHAYCEWAGKYLCGKVQNGKKVSGVGSDGLADHASHQWLVACSAAGRRRFPYGGLFDPTRCNVGDYEAGAPVPVGSTSCVGGYDGVHDLIGNVWEWFDGPCDPVPDAGGPESDSCLIKGGAFRAQGATMDCETDTSVPRDYRGDNVGIRCCSD